MRRAGATLMTSSSSPPSEFYLPPVCHARGGGVMSFAQPGSSLNSAETRSFLTHGALEPAKPVNGEPGTASPSLSLEDTSPPSSADAARPECGHCWRHPRDSAPPEHA